MNYMLAASAALFCLVTPVSPHMELSWPPGLRSKYNPYTPEAKIDYNMMAPLDADGSNFPCKGYQNDAAAQAVATYHAGKQYNMSLAGTATHGGGSCKCKLEQTRLLFLTTSKVSYRYPTTMAQLSE